MTLVDTSVLIDMISGKKTKQTKIFDEILDSKKDYYITCHVYQEVLQGANSEKNFESLKNYLDSMVCIYPLPEIEFYQRVSRLYYDCRKKGITIRNSIDCIIAQLAIDHNLDLLHSDKDFDRIASVIKKLRVI